MSEKVRESSERFGAESFGCTTERFRESVRDSSLGTACREESDYELLDWLLYRARQYIYLCN